MKCKKKINVKFMFFFKQKLKAVFVDIIIGYIIDDDHVPPTPTYFLKLSQYCICSI